MGLRARLLVIGALAATVFGLYATNEPQFMRIRFSDATVDLPIAALRALPSTALERMFAEDLFPGEALVSHKQMIIPQPMGFMKADALRFFLALHAGDTAMMAQYAGGLSFADIASAADFLDIQFSGGMQQSLWQLMAVFIAIIAHKAKDEGILLYFSDYSRLFPGLYPLDVLPKLSFENMWQTASYLDKNSLLAQEDYAYLAKKIINELMSAKGALTFEQMHDLLNNYKVSLSLMDALIDQIIAQSVRTGINLAAIDDQKFAVAEALAHLNSPDLNQARIQTLLEGDGEFQYFSDDLGDYHNMEVLNDGVYATYVQDSKWQVNGGVARGILHAKLLDLTKDTAPLYLSFAAKLAYPDMPMDGEFRPVIGSVTPADKPVIRYFYIQSGHSLENYSNKRYMSNFGLFKTNFLADTLVVEPVFSGLEEGLISSNDERERGSRIMSAVKTDIVYTERQFLFGILLEHYRALAVLAAADLLRVRDEWNRSYPEQSITQPNGRERMRTEIVQAKNMLTGLPIAFTDSDGYHSAQQVSV